MTILTNEQTSGKYTAVLVDETGTAVPASALTSLTLTLYDRDTATIINTRNAQNVLNANQVTIDANGNLAWKWLPADQTLISSTLDLEVHIALWVAKWIGVDGLARELPYELKFQVRRVPQIA